MVVVRMMIIGRSSAPEELKQRHPSRFYETITIEQTMTHMTSCTDRHTSESDSVPVPIHLLTVDALWGWARSGGCVIRFREVCVKEVVVMVAREC